MTVKELIEQLKTLPLDAEVLVEDYDADFDIASYDSPDVNYEEVGFDGVQDSRSYRVIISGGI